MNQQARVYAAPDAPDTFDELEHTGEHVILEADAISIELAEIVDVELEAA